MGLFLAMQSEHTSLLVSFLHVPLCYRLCGARGTVTLIRLVVGSPWGPTGICARPVEQA
jgi:hypothetical protein